MKRKMLHTLSVLLVFGMLAGCGGQNTPANEPTPAPPAATPEAQTPATAAQIPAPEPVELFVSAAASLTDVMAEIAEEYKSVAPHVNLTFSFGSSGALQTQIEEGAPADLFISAAQKQMNALEEKNLIVSGTRTDLLINKVTLITPANSTADINSFEDVTTDKVKMVAIGEASVPVGQYTQDIYTNLGTWDIVSSKANLGSDVRAVLAWVESGDVDCGIVYATDAMSTDKVKIVAEAPEGSHTPVIYPAAVLESSEHRDEAAAFIAYLGAKNGGSVFFEAAGFTMAN